MTKGIISAIFLHGGKQREAGEGEEGMKRLVEG